MTDEEAAAWLEEHRAQLELIVLTRKLTGRRVLGSTDAAWVLRVMQKELRGLTALAVTKDAAWAIRAFASWSAGVGP